jgi:hypothetical protein
MMTLPHFLKAFSLCILILFAFYQHRGKTAKKSSSKDHLRNYKETGQVFGPRTTIFSRDPVSLLCIFPIYVLASVGEFSQADFLG